MSDMMTMDAEPQETGDNRPSCYIEDGRVIFRASAVGRSSHVLAASAAGVMPASFTERTKGYFHEGNLHEPDIINRVASDGWAFSHIGTDQDELLVPVSSRIAIRCHPDGYATATKDHRFAVKGTRCVFEGKAMSKDVFDRWDRRGFDDFWSYAVQFSIEMEGSGLPGLFAVKNRNNGEVRWQVFTTPPIPFAEIRKRLLLVEKGARGGDLNPLKEKCKEFGCQYFFLHDDTGPEIVADDVIDGLAEMVDAARDRRKQAETIEKDARDKLSMAMGERKKVATGRWAVTMVEQNRTTYDTKQAMADGIDLEPYKKISTSRYPRLDSMTKGSKE